jgi:hypothetical protein
MRDFPDEMMPDDGEKVSIAEYRAMAEWHWAHNTSPQSRPHLRERSDRRRAELCEQDVDLDDHRQVDALWAGWQHTWHEALNYGVDSFGEELLPMLVHVMQYTSIMLLLSTEDVPDPLVETLTEDDYDD